MAYRHHTSSERREQRLAARKAVAQERGIFDLLRHQRETLRMVREQPDPAVRRMGYDWLRAVIELPEVGR